MGDLVRVIGPSPLNDAGSRNDPRSKPHMKAAADEFETELKNLILKHLMN